MLDLDNDIKAYVQKVKQKHGRYFLKNIIIKLLEMKTAVSEMKMCRMEIMADYTLQKERLAMEIIQN